MKCKECETELTKDNKSTAGNWCKPCKAAYMRKYSKKKKRAYKPKVITQDGNEYLQADNFVLNSY